MVLRNGERKKTQNEWQRLQWMTVTASPFHFTVFFDLFTFFFQIIIESHIVRSRSSAPKRHKCGNSAIHNTFDRFEYIFFYALSPEMRDVACFISFHIAHESLRLTGTCSRSPHKTYKEGKCIWIFFSYIFFRQTRCNECDNQIFGEFKLNEITYL